MRSEHATMTASSLGIMVHLLNQLYTVISALTGVQWEMVKLLLESPIHSGQSHTLLWLPATPVQVDVQIETSVIYRQFRVLDNATIFNRAPCSSKPGHEVTLLPHYHIDSLGTSMI